MLLVILKLSSTVGQKGSFTNHVDKMRWVVGKSNVQDCPCRIGGWSLKCPHGQNIRKIEDIELQNSHFSSKTRKTQLINYKSKLSVF